MSESQAGAGHNSGDQRLRSIVERVERLIEERKALTSDISDIYKEAKSAGYDVKALRKLVAERSKDPREIEEQEQLLDVYRNALGMFAETPLGEAALRRVGG